jgi:hypothetical protein
LYNFCLAKPPRGLQMATWALPVAVGWRGGAARGRGRCAANLASWE